MERHIVFMQWRLNIDGNIPKAVYTFNATLTKFQQSFLQKWESQSSNSYGLYKEPQIQNNTEKEQTWKTYICLFQNYHEVIVIKTI